MVHFPTTNALDCRILHIKSQKFSVGDTPKPVQREGVTLSRTHPSHAQGTQALPVLGPRHQFSFGSPAFPLFLFNKMTPDQNSIKSVHKVVKRCYNMSWHSRILSVIHSIQRMVEVWVTLASSLLSECASK